jgi:hypothetical protein
MKLMTSKKMEDNLTKKEMEENLKNEMKDDLKIIKLWKTTSKKMEDNLKKWKMTSTKMQMEEDLN